MNPIQTINISILNHGLSWTDDDCEHEAQEIRETWDKAYNELCVLLNPLLPTDISIETGDAHISFYTKTAFLSYENSAKIVNKIKELFRVLYVDYYTEYESLHDRKSSLNIGIRLT